MIDAQVKRLLLRAFNEGGELSAICKDDPEAIFPGIERASQLGYLSYTQGTGLDDVQFWFLTDEGYQAVGKSPPKRWSLKRLVYRMFKQLFAYIPV
jgi:hypothetical protein